jgi:mono/diheme cytochrome c family protein
MKLRHFCGSIAVAHAVLFTGCQSNLSSSAPPITASFIHAGIREKGDAGTLAQGRTVFLNRCIQCHALPHVTGFDAPRLTAIVAKMSGRSNLTPEQHDAVLKYLLTVRSGTL